MAAYVTAANGLWSDPATWTTAIPAGGPGLNQADNDTVTINHDVTHDRAGITWLGTGATASVAVQINAGGALRMSRTASGTLRCWGDVVVNPLGTLDFGTIASPIPATVNAFLQFRSSRGTTNNMRVLYCENNSEVYFHGTRNRTRKTKLIQQMNFGDTSMRVADATGWQVGDFIVTGVSNGNFNTPVYTRITSITQNGPADWTIGFTGISNSVYAINKPVGNAECNVAVYAVEETAPFGSDLDYYNTAAPVNGGVYLGGIWIKNTATPIRANTRVFRQMRIGVGGGFAGLRGCVLVQNQVADSNVFAELQDIVLLNRGGGNGLTISLDGQCGGFDINGAFCDWFQLESVGYLFANLISRFSMTDFLVTYGAISTSTYDAVNWTFRNGAWIGSFQFQESNSQSMNGFVWEDVAFGVSPSVFGSRGPGQGGTFRRCLFGITYSEDPVRGYMETSGQVAGLTPTFNITTSAEYKYIDCRFSTGFSFDTYYGFGGAGAMSTVSSSTTRLIIANQNENPALQTIYTPDGWFKLNAATFRSAPYSLSWTPNARNRPQSLTFNVLAPNNAQVPVSGFLRRDTSYISGGGTIVATLSGPGITAQTYTTSDAANTWEQFAFNVVQSTGVGAVLTLTLTFRGTTGNAFVDDIVAPSSQAVSTGEFSYWADGQPIQTVLANFAPAADVWSIPITNLTTPNSIGQALANVESGLTVQEALRLLLAVAAGDVVGGPDGPIFKSLAGTKNRIVGVATPNGNRTRTSIDVS